MWCSNASRISESAIAAPYHQAAGCVALHGPEHLIQRIAHVPRDLRLVRDDCARVRACGVVERTERRAGVVAGEHHDVAGLVEPEPEPVSALLFGHDAP